MLFIIMDKSSKNIELNGQFYIHILGAMLKNQRVPCHANEQKQPSEIYSLECQRHDSKWIEMVKLDGDDVHWGLRVQ